MRSEPIDSVEAAFGKANTPAPVLVAAEKTAENLERTRRRK